MWVAQGSPNGFDVEFGDGSELEVAMSNMAQATVRAEELARLLAEANAEYKELVSAAVLDRGLSEHLISLPTTLCSHIIGLSNPFPEALSRYSTPGLRIELSYVWLKLQEAGGCSCLAAE